MKVYVVTFNLHGRRVACEVAAHDEDETIRVVRKDEYSRDATNIKVMGALDRPAVLRWLPHIPSGSWVARRNEEDESRVFVFDGDDTLWYVEWKYSQAYADFLKYLYQILREDVPSFHFLYQMLFRMEDKNSKTMGIRRGRVAESMVETYRACCEWIKKRSGRDIWRKDHEARIRAIGDQPFDIWDHHWIPGAEEMLEKLLGCGHTPCLLTKYDRGTWQEKASELRISRFFEEERILVVEGKKQVEDFRNLAKAAMAKMGPVYTVGNSESDMIPVSADERWHGFYIPLPTTLVLDPDTLPTEDSFEPKPYNHPRVKMLKSIGELAAYL